MLDSQRVHGKHVPPGMLGENLAPSNDMTSIILNKDNTYQQQAVVDPWLLF